MDMDDNDFMADAEFTLSQEQQDVVSRAISLATEARDDDEDFIKTNPLISIMQWWEASGATMPAATAGPEATLVEICRRYIAAHSGA